MSRRAPSTIDKPHTATQPPQPGSRKLTHPTTHILHPPQNHNLTATLNPDKPVNPLSSRSQHSLTPVQSRLLLDPIRPTRSLGKHRIHITSTLPHLRELCYPNDTHLTPSFADRSRDIASRSTTTTPNYLLVLPFSPAGTALYSLGNKFHANLSPRTDQAAPEPKWRSTRQALSGRRSSRWRS